MDDSLIKPGTTEEALERVQQALAEHRPLQLYGGRTKERIGCRPKGGISLDGSGLAGIVSYEPRELILVAGPGTRLRQVEEVLAAEGQHLPFEPPAWGTDATLGGTVACNLSGPRRFKAGALRDYVLGVELINGQGERVRTGGKVVKNVSGYDLSKVLSGSFGTLGLMTEICLKVWPRPETRRTLVVRGLELVPALAWLQRLAGLPYEITGLAYMQAFGTEASQTLVRLEGAEPAVKAQLAALEVPPVGELEVLDEEASATVWEALCELGASSLGPGLEHWRFALPSNKTAALLEAIGPHQPVRYRCDWAGGLVWVVFPSPTSVSRLHQLAAEHHGVAWRIGTGTDDANPEAFTPLAPGVARLNQRLKEAFDPQGIFNPGRLGF